MTIQKIRQSITPSRITGGCPSQRAHATPRGGASVTPPPLSDYPRKGRKGCKGCSQGSERRISLRGGVIAPFSVRYTRVNGEVVSDE